MTASANCVAEKSGSNVSFARIADDGWFLSPSAMPANISNDINIFIVPTVNGGLDVEGCHCCKVRFFVHVKRVRRRLAQQLRVVALHSTAMSNLQPRCAVVLTGMTNSTSISRW